MSFFAYECTQFRKRGVRTDADHVGIGHHHCSRRRVVEFEDLFDHLDFLAVDQPLASRPAQQHQQFLLAQCLLGFGGRRDADEPGERVRRPVEHDDTRNKQVIEEAHRWSDEQRELFGPLDGDGLGCQFPEDDVEERDETEGDCERHEMHRSRREDGVEYRLDECRHGGFADPPESERGDGDTELRGR